VFVVQNLLSQFHPLLISPSLCEISSCGHVLVVGEHSHGIFWVVRIVILLVLILMLEFVNDRSVFGHIDQCQVETCLKFVPHFCRFVFLELTDLDIEFKLTKESNKIKILNFCKRD
jgi:hypothetical protein